MTAIPPPPAPPHWDPPGNPDAVDPLRSAADRVGVYLTGDVPGTRPTGPARYVRLTAPGRSGPGFGVAGGLSPTATTVDGPSCLTADPTADQWSLEVLDPEGRLRLRTSATSPVALAQTAGTGRARVRDLVCHNVSEHPWLVQPFNEAFAVTSSGGAVYSAYLWVPVIENGTVTRLDGGCVAARTSADGSSLDDLVWRRTWWADDDPDPRPAPTTARHDRAPTEPAVPWDRLPWNVSRAGDETGAGDADLIARLHARYTWCLDQGDDAGLADCFTHDVLTDLEPSPGRVHGRDVLVSALAEVRSSALVMQHCVADHVVDVRGDIARMTAKAIVPRLVPERRQPVFRTGRYLAHVRRTDTGWKFDYFSYRRADRSDPAA